MSIAEGLFTAAASVPLWAYPRRESCDTLLRFRRPLFRNTFSGSGKTAAGRPFLRAKRESICRLPLPQRPGKPPPAFLRASLPRPERAVLEFSFLQFPRKRPYRRKSFSVLFHFCLINVISQGIDGHNGGKVLYRVPADSLGAQVFVAEQLLLDDASGDQGRRAANGGEITPRFRTIASTTGALLAPLPIMPFRPRSKRAGV